MKTIRGLCLGLILTGCGSQPESPPASDAAGRPDTKAVEAARAVGYDGKQMRRALDNALDRAEERKKELETVTRP